MTLFIENLPKKTKAAELKELSPDIHHIQMGTGRMVVDGKSKGKKVQFAYLEFKDVETCVANHAKLQGAKIRDQVLSVDFLENHLAEQEKNEENEDNEENAEKETKEEKIEEKVEKVGEKRASSASVEPASKKVKG